jgi:hypothetical protein
MDRQPLLTLVGMCLPIIHLNFECIYYVLLELGVTSIPACRDAPCNETKRRYFEFKRLKICECIKISIYFYFSCITYLSRTLLTY